MGDYDRGYGRDDDRRDGGMQREEKPMDFDVVDRVKDFVFDLHDSMRRSQQIEELETLYTTTFKKLSDEYYKQEPWPAAEVIASQCGNDELFLFFYNEMRFRHMTQNIPSSSTITDCFDAWANYSALFDALLDCRDTEFIITASWAFDIIQEFVYQFQSFCQFRTQLDKRSGEERQLLQDNQDVWAVQNVLSYLHGIVRVSNIVPILESKRSATASGTAVPKPPSQLHQMVGYFAIVGMSRLQCLLGDYYECLNVLEPLDVTDRNELFASNLPAYVSLYMHMGLSFLMLKRYRDATRTFNEILVHISRAIKTGQGQKPGMEQIPKQFDKMLALVTISSFLSPGQTIDESVTQAIQDKHSDKLTTMAAGTDASLNTLRDLFQFAGPKFIVASVPDYSVSANTSNALINQQVRLFVDEMRQQLIFHKVRSYLKLYTTISVEKIARFNGMDTATFLATIVSMKYKLTQTEWGYSSETPPVSGKQALALEFNYFVEDDTIIIDERAREQRFEKYFITQISKCDDIVSQVAQINF